MKYLIVILLTIVSSAYGLTLQSSNYQIVLDENKIQLSIIRDGELVYQTHHSKTSWKNSFAILPQRGGWQSARYFVGSKNIDNGYLIQLKTKKNIPINLYLTLSENEIELSIQAKKSCREIRINSRIKTSGHWYGEGETVSRLGVVPIIRGKMQQYWPLSRGEISRKKMATTDNSSVLVPFWITSKGFALFSDSYHYLKERFNVRKSGIFSLGMLHNKETRPDNRKFKLHLIVANDIRQAYLHWIHKTYRVKKAWNPNNPLPPYEMFKAPIWTTWATYKNKIDTQKVLEYATKIQSEGYPYSILEIDDRWQDNYGDLSFDLDRFPNAAQAVSTLGDMGFATTVWIPPFVNKRSAMYDELKGSSGLIQTKKGKTHHVSWWDTMYLLKNSAMFNFFNPEFKELFTEKVQDFTEEFNLLGIKYDAGETVYLKDKLNTFGHHPNSYSDLYIQDWRQMKAMEFRAATFSQHEAPIVREFDKNSTWDNYTGLKSVLTQAMAMSIVGYPYVLPDMVGGNKYPFSNLSDELFIRWVQLNAFMPMIQLSLGPWEFSPKTQALTKKYLSIHQELVPYIWEEVKSSNLTAMPLVRPLFMEYPQDQNTFELNDQFLLGSIYLVAPVLDKNVRSRDIYLPKGSWKEFWSQKVYYGPKWIKDYPAPLETIPVFIRQ